jgi:hypothetical protein
MTGSSGVILQGADSSGGTERRGHGRLHRSLEDVCGVDEELASDDDYKEREFYLLPAVNSTGSSERGSRR